MGKYFLAWILGVPAIVLLIIFFIFYYCFSCASCDVFGFQVVDVGQRGRHDRRQARQRGRGVVPRVVEEHIATQNNADGVRARRESGFDALPSCA